MVSEMTTSQCKKFIITMQCYMLCNLEVFNYDGRCEINRAKDHQGWVLKLLVNLYRKHSLAMLFQKSYLKSYHMLIRKETHEFESIPCIQSSPFRFSGGIPIPSHYFAIILRCLEPNSCANMLYDPIAFVLPHEEHLSEANCQVRLHSIFVFNSIVLIIISCSHLHNYYSM